MRRLLGKNNEARREATPGGDWRRSVRLAVLVALLVLTIADVQAQPPASSPSAQIPPPASPAGWSTFEIKKTAAELAETARLADDPQLMPRTGQNDVKLPPQRDLLRMTTGLGYLQGADWGGDVSASGRINGMQTDLSTFFTAGPMGLQSRSARVSIFAPDGKWRGEGGDMYSDLRGLARGARVSWSLGQRWTPSVAVYLQSRQGASNGATVLAYRDRVQVLPHVRVGGEVTSDGAAFLQTQYAQPKLDVTTFYRFTRGPIAGRDKGVSGGLTLGRGVAVIPANGSSPRFDCPWRGRPVSRWNVRGGVDRQRTAPRTPWYCSFPSVRSA
jgi:hypothetical protein